MDIGIKTATELNASSNIDFPMSIMLSEVNGNGEKKTPNEDTNSMSMLTNEDTIGSNTKGINRYIKTKFHLDKVF